MRLRISTNDGRTTLRSLSKDRRDKTIYGTVTCEKAAVDMTHDEVEADIRYLTAIAVARYAATNLPQGYTASKEEK